MLKCTSKLVNVGYVLSPIQSNMLLIFSFSLGTTSCSAQDLLSALHSGDNYMSGIKTGSVVYNASALPAKLSYWPPNMLFLMLNLKIKFGMMTLEKRFT